MSDLKLSRLPDRTPVKIVLAIPPDLNQALRDYASVYRATYGQTVSVAELIPFMLTAFLESDKGFTKARREVVVEQPADLPRRPVRRPKASDVLTTSPSTTHQEE